MLPSRTASKPPCSALPHRWACSAALAPLALTALSAVEPRAVPIALDGLATRLLSTSAGGAEANDASSYPVLSSDGHFVAFASSASNLVPGDANEAGDVFRKDTVTGAIACVSVASNGFPALDESSSPSISGDGQRVVFASEASDIIATDTNKLIDIFLRELGTQTTTRISESASGAQADGSSSGPRLSADGRFVAFASVATNLVPGDTNGMSDVFVRDLQPGAVERISAGASGVQTDGASEGPSISADGRWVAFASTALNLLSGSTNGEPVRVWDVYVRDRVNGTTVRASSNLLGGKGNGHSFLAAISGEALLVNVSETAVTPEFSVEGRRLDLRDERHIEPLERTPRRELGAKRRAPFEGCRTES